MDDFLIFIKQKDESLIRASTEKIEEDVLRLKMGLKAKDREEVSMSCFEDLQNDLQEMVREEAKDAADYGYVEKVIKVSMEKRENESDEEAYERLYEVLYDGLCNNAEHTVYFEYL